MGEIKVSIITPALDSEKTIVETIESVLSQTYDNIEYIIIDGGSSDHTFEFANSFEKKFKVKGYDYKVFSERDSGIYNAMNKGIDKSTGKLIGILNSDDWYEHDAISSIVAEFEKQGDAIYYGMLRMFKQGHVYHVKQHTHHFVNEHMPQHPTWFVPKKVYDEIGNYDERYRISGDYEFANRCTKYKIPFVRMEKVITNFRIGGASSASNSGVLESMEIKYKYGTISKVDLDLFRIQQWVNRNIMRRIYRVIAIVLTKLNSSK